MTTYRRGQVVVVNLPFTVQGGTKPRPALVLSENDFHRRLPDLIVCPISSQPRFFSKPGTGDHPLRHWRSIGLLHPSTARLSNLMAVDKRIVKRVLGIAHRDDLARIKHGLHRGHRPLEVGGKHLLNGFGGF